MHRKRIKKISIILLATISLSLVGCQKQDIFKNINIDENVEVEVYTQEDLQNEYKQYLEYLTLLTHEIPLDIYTILGYNQVKTKYEEFKQTQLISFEHIKGLYNLSQNAKVLEIKELSTKLLKASENTQYKLVEIANKEGIIETVNEIRPIIEEYNTILTSDIAKTEHEKLVPLFKDIEVLNNIKKDFSKGQSKFFKQQRERYIADLEYLYGDRTKKVLNRLYDNL